MDKPISAGREVEGTLDPMQEASMFFIIGKGRSGTTLLQALLDAHPNVLIPLESRFVIHFKRKYANVKRWSEEKIMEFYHDLYTEAKFRKLWRVDSEKLKHELLAVREKASYRVLCRIVYLNYISVFRKDDIRLIGDKNPSYTIFTKELLEIFPEAKFIHLVRDYRDNINSHMKVFPVKNVPYLACKWKYFNAAAERLKCRYPQQVITVRYEDLVTQPLEELERVCAFLGIGFTPGMMEFHKGTNKERERLGQYIDKLHSNLVNPVNSSKMDVWKSEMKDEHVRLADGIAGNYARRYGYERRYNESAIGLKFIELYSNLKLTAWLFIIRSYFQSPLWMRRFGSDILWVISGKKHQERIW